MKSLIISLLAFMTVNGEEARFASDLLNFSTEEVRSALLINNPSFEDEEELHPIEDVLEKAQERVDSSALDKLEAPFV